jgi:S1-C subfamily serine protease
MRPNIHRRGLIMATPDSLLAFSDQTADLVARTANSVVAVHGAGRPLSGILWRPGAVVTAEESLEGDDNITVTLPGGRRVKATLAGRDPTTDVAALRIEADGVPPVATAEASGLRAGQLIVAVGNYEGAPVAGLGIVAFVGGPWQSFRGGAIDSFLRLDVGLNPRAEGGAVVDGRGATVGMAVFGPRRRVLAIPTATINRSLDQLLAKGHVSRGYLGAGLQPIRGERRSQAASDHARGILVVSIDPQGPAARGGMFVGDIITAWNGKPVERVREVMRLLGADSIGGTVELALTRAGAAISLKVVIGERALA